MFKWLKEINQRPPDDLIRNFMHLIFWAIVLGIVLLGLALWG